jgi:crotonobetainyl-CoA:carnitine CoA-transferase CaiB-like acyl-CoA transferase
MAHWTAVLDRHDVANDPVQNSEDLMHDPQIAALGQLERVPLAGAEAALLPRLPLGFSATPAAIQGPPPELGEHTGAVLREAGLSDTEIEELVHAGVCGPNGVVKCQP